MLFTLFHDLFAVLKNQFLVDLLKVAHFRKNAVRILKIHILICSVKWWRFWLYFFDMTRDRQRTLILLQQGLGGALER